ncbi:MAG: hypothetical protein M9916_10960 [Crocinitomicaceae bacterium]|nr:hypothetical protein [Crocinitomicaceae bacterium]
MRIVLLVLIFLSPILAISQGWIPIGSRSNSLANASVTLVDAWSYHHNPGALGEITQPTVGISYENRFLLKEFQSQGIAYAHPLKYGVISVGAQLYGYKLFRTQRVGVGYSLPLTKRLFAGVQLNYQGLQLNANYGNKNTVTGEFGLQALLTDNWKLGFSVLNIGASKLNSYQNERFSTHFRLGMSYLLAEKVLFLLEGSKTIVDKIRIKGAIEYQAVKNFFIRAGIASAPLEFSFGFGYKWKIISFDIGSSYHQVLGWSPNISLTYTANKKKVDAE